MGLENIAHDAVMLRPVTRPVDMDAVFLRVFFKLLKIFRQARERVFLDAGRFLAQFLPFGQHVHLGVALLAHVPQAFVMELEVGRVFQEMLGSPGVVDGSVAHWAAPLRICAIWMKRMGTPARSAQPCWCIMHDESAETMYSAPA